MRRICGIAMAVAAVLALAGAAQAQEFFTLKGHGGPVKGVAVARDGAILTASFDNSVGVWRDGAPHWLEGHAAAVNAVVSPAPGVIASAGDDFTVRLWRDGQSQVLGQHAGKVIRLAAAPDGGRIASASWDGSAVIWSLDGADPVALDGHRSNVNDVAFSPDGAQVFTASSDGTIRVWDAATGAFRRQLVSHGFGVNAMIVNRDDDWLAYGAVDGGTRVIRISDGAEIGDFTLDRRPILAMAHDPASGLIAVGDAQGFIMMLQAGDWAITDDFRATLSGPIWALAFSRDGRNILAGGLDTALYSWPVQGLGEAPRMTDAAQGFLTPPEEMSNGERQFMRKCSICHALGPDGGRRAGPTLYRLFGRPAGSVDGYSYSATLDGAGIVWDATSIDALFDLGPDHYIPGSKMPMQRITAATDRADLVAFLREATAP